MSSSSRILTDVSAILIFFFKLFHTCIIYAIQGYEKIRIDWFQVFVIIKTTFLTIWVILVIEIYLLKSISIRFQSPYKEIP